MILSVIIPVYNVQDYLERCLNSVISKNEKEVEIVLIDDGSTDNSPAICDSYSKRYKNIVVEHQKNGGLSAARNTGIRIATGKHFAFLDSDDMVDANFIEDIVKVIKEYEPDMISFPCCHEYKKNEYKIRGDRGIKEASDFDYFQKILENKLGSQICFHVYKNSLFNGLEFPIGCHYEDMRIFWELVAKSKKIIDIDYTYYIYNLTNPSSITKNASIKSMQDMKLSIDIMIHGIIDLLKESQQLNGKLFECAQYAKLNGYIYIAYKLRNVQCDSTGLKEELNKYIKSARINLWKYRNYDWKKYLVCKVLMMIGKM